MKLFIHKITAGSGLSLRSLKQALVISCLVLCLHSGLFAQPPNDLCSSVTPTTLVTGVPQTFTGNTVGATDDGDFYMPTVWEAVTLTGSCNNLFISYCGTSPTFDDVWINLATDCSFNVVLTADDYYDCGDGNYTLEYHNLPPGTYYIPVLGDEPGFVTPGPYTMEVTTMDCPPPPANDLCDGAITVNCGDVVTGSTISATGDFIAPDCTFGDASGGGVWYTFTGTGAPWSITLCGSDYDTYLSLYSGPDCATLICEDANDDGDNCGDVSSELVDVPTVAGATYYILINGYDGDIGNYELTVTSSPPANDDCADAISIGSGTHSGTTSCATTDVAPSCGTAADSPAGGVWYTYSTACSSDITASLCGGATFNTQLRVFSGTCGALVCVGGNDDNCGTQSEVTWTGAAGTTYYILVHGSGSEAGSFDLTLSQVDASAPVADVPSLTALSGDCSVSVPTPTATDNCAGAITGTTSDPVVYTVPGPYVVTWTYDDGNGNTSTQTQNVTVNPDLIAPTIVCLNDTSLSTDADACGAVVNYDMPIVSDNCYTPYPGTDVYYVVSNSEGQPWGSSDIINAMDAVFGPGGWNSEYYETMTPASVFTGTTKFVYLEGSDANASELADFLTTNISLIESFVNNGGKLLINAAPNENNNIDLGFGGTVLNYDGGFSSTCDVVTAVDPLDPIFNGPFLPAGTDYTGNSFSHAYITGTGLTDHISGCGFFELSSKTWGDGFVAFGGMTVPQYQDPLPNAQNLRQNILDYVSSYSTNTSVTVTQTAGLASGALFPVGTTTNTFLVTDLAGNTNTCSFDVTVSDLTPPGGSLILTISYGDVNLDETTWQLYDATNTLIYSGGPYGSGMTPGTIAETIDISSAMEPLSFAGQTVGFWGDNVLTYDFSCNGTSIASGNIYGGSTDSIPGIQGCNPVLANLSDPCSVTISGPAPTLNDNCAGTITGTTTDPLTYSSNGVYTITWTFNDGNGNTSTRTQTVTILDTIAPVPNAIILASVTGECTATISAVPTATDNCTATVTGTTTDPVTYNVAGTYTVTWTYTDASGNTATQTQMVTVTDSGSPVPVIANLPNVVGNCVVNIPAPPTASDACAGTITATTTDPTTYNLIGTFLVIWHYNDGNGNTWTQNQTVVVNPCLGVENESGQWDAMIYPNPGSGIFTLSLSEMPVENTEIRLIDALGQVLYAGVLQNQVQQFDFSGLASATYYLLITNNNGHLSKPVIIRHNY
jgi:hypothetical protein